MAVRVRQIIFASLLLISAFTQASETQSMSTSTDSGPAIGQVKYELPHNLGTLSMQMPLHWVGGRTEGVEALWIDQQGSPFKDNVTLVIRSGNKVSDSEALLDKSVTSIVNNTEHTAASAIRSKENGRMFDLKRVANGLEITQTSMIIYRESADKSYLLILTYTRPVNSETVDFSKVTVG